MKAVRAYAHPLSRSILSLAVSATPALVMAQQATPPDPNTPLGAGLTVNTAAVSRANVSQMQQVIAAAILERAYGDRQRPNGVVGEPVAIRITGARLTGPTPVAVPFFVEQGAVALLQCPGTGNLRRSVTLTATDRSELTFSSVQRMTASVSTEVSGGAGPISASVSAGFEYATETGRTQTTGREVSLSTTDEVEVAEGRGFWFAPISMRQTFNNAPYEIDIEVTQARVLVPFPGRRIPLPVFPQNLPIRLTLQGSFSGHIPAASAPGIGSLAMPQSTIDQACNQQVFTGGAQAGVGTRNTPPQGARVPAPPVFRPGPVPSTVTVRPPRAG